MTTQWCGDYTDDETYWCVSQLRKTGWKKKSVWTNLAKICSNICHGHGSLPTGSLRTFVFLLCCSQGVNAIPHLFSFWQLVSYQADNRVHTCEYSSVKLLVRGPVHKETLLMLDAVVGRLLLMWVSGLERKLPQPHAGNCADSSLSHYLLNNAHGVHCLSTQCAEIISEKTKKRKSFQLFPFK